MPCRIEIISTRKAPQSVGPFSQATRGEVDRSG